MKTHTNENGQMTKMAAVLIFGKKKNLENFSSHNQLTDGFKI